jgi:hypothetical protein
VCYTQTDGVVRDTISPVLPVCLIYFAAWKEDLMSTKVHESAAPRTMPWHAPALLRRVPLPNAAPGEDSYHFIEARWPISLAVILAVALSATLPGDLTLGPAWLAALIEVALLLPLLLSEPHWHPNAGWPWQRAFSLLLVGVLTLSTLASLVLLIDTLLKGALLAGLMPAVGQEPGNTLIVEAGKIWIANILVFALWYWEIDRGGPRARHWRTTQLPDFLFPQMSSPDVAPSGWMPTFFDYLYLAFTNATAFSPTDTLPLTAGVKLLMGIQSVISLLTVALVAARAVNILT